MGSRPLGSEKGVGNMRFTDSYSLENKGEESRSQKPNKRAKLKPSQNRFQNNIELKRM